MTRKRALPLNGDGGLDANERWFAAEPLAADAAPRWTAAPLSLTELHREEYGGLHALIDSVVRFVRRYVVLNDAQADAVALWVMHTHTQEVADATPYLSITSAEKRSGKTLLLDVLGLLVRAPLSTMNISEAALFRTIEAKTPTLLFDELDAIFGPKARDREDMRGLLNSGYRRGQKVFRMGGAQKTTLEEFDVFCPKALAGIGALPDTLADRSIPIRLKRKARAECVERFRRRDVRPEATALRERLESWAEGNLEAMSSDPEVPDELDDRAAEVWEPLLSIADLAGGDWPKRARQAAVELSAGREPEDDSIGVRLLSDVRDVFDAQACDRLPTAELLDALAGDEEAPWADWRDRGRRLSPRELAAILKRYSIRGGTIRLPDGRTPKGYKREDFEDAWTRYLPFPAVLSATSATTASLSQKRALFHPPQTTDVADGKRGANPHDQTVVADVADRSADMGAGGSIEGLPTADGAV